MMRFFSIDSNSILLLLLLQSRNNTFALQNNVQININSHKMQGTTIIRKKASWGGTRLAMFPNDYLSSLDDSDENIAIAENGSPYATMERSSEIDNNEEDSFNLDYAAYKEIQSETGALATDIPQIQQQQQQQTKHANRPTLPKVKTQKIPKEPVESSTSTQYVDFNGAPLPEYLVPPATLVQKMEVFLKSDANRPTLPKETSKDLLECSLSPEYVDYNGVPLPEYLVPPCIE